MWKLVTTKKIIFFPAIYLLLNAVALIFDWHIFAIFLLAPSGLFLNMTERLIGMESGFLIGNTYVLVLAGTVQFIIIGLIWDYLAMYLRKLPSWS